MKQEFLDYLAALKMPEVTIKRVQEVYRFYSEVCPLSIERILVTDSISPDGSRSFESLWFFTKRHGMEAAGFVHSDSFDVGDFQGISLWRVEKSEYDFVKASSKSRMNLTISGEDVSGDLRATGENCDYLRDLVIEWVVPLTAGFKG